MSVGHYGHSFKAASESYWRGPLTSTATPKPGGVRGGSSALQREQGIPGAPQVHGLRAAPLFQGRFWWASHTHPVSSQLLQLKIIFDPSEVNGLSGELVPRGDNAELLARWDQSKFFRLARQGERSPTKLRDRVLAEANGGTVG